jgi:hypothetical protein
MSLLGSSMHKAKIPFLFFQIILSLGAMTPTPSLVNKKHNPDTSLPVQKQTLMSGLQKNTVLKKSALFCALGATYYGANYLSYFLQDRTERTTKITKRCAELNHLIEAIDSAKELQEDSSPQVRELAKAVRDKSLTASHTICPLRETILSSDNSFNFSFTQGLKAAFFKQERERFCALDTFENALDTYLDTLYKNKELLMAVSQKKS